MKKQLLLLIVVIVTAISCQKENKTPIRIYSIGQKLKVRRTLLGLAVKLENYKHEKLTEPLTLVGYSSVDGVYTDNPADSVSGANNIPGVFYQEDLKPY